MLFMVAGMFIACANEDITQEDKKNEAPKGGVIFATNESKVMAKPQTINNENGVAGAKTRTTIVHTPGNGADAYWNEDDFIWVEKHDGSWVKSSHIELHDGGASAEFTLPGSKSDYDDGCRVHYTGSQTSYIGAYVFSIDASHIGIPNNQTRTKANDFSKAGEWGDCGSGRAHNTGNPVKYNFTLAHKPAYLCFLPRCENAPLSRNIRLTSINIKETKDYHVPSGFIADYCGFNGEDIVSSAGSPVGQNQIKVALPNFSLDTKANQALNATNLVVRPSTYDLKIEYFIEDPTTNLKTTITDYTTKQILDKGNIYDITANLIPNKYYMWDAKQDFWSGHLKPEGTPDGNYAWNTIDPRWHNEIDVAATQSCKDCPNINEICWYFYKGDPHWAKGSFITAKDGHLQIVTMYGLWLKKKAAILRDNSEITSDRFTNSFPWNGVEHDWRTDDFPPYMDFSAPTLSSPPNTTDYFFLPALGCYIGDELKDFNVYGYYWSSSTPSNNSDSSFPAIFGNNLLRIEPSYSRSYGFQARVFE